MMHSLFLLCCLVNFVSVYSEIELFFDTENKCGCYSLVKCPNLLKPNCSVEDKLEDLYEQNSPSSRSPELCSKWFLEGFKIQLISLENGILNISIFFSPMIDEKITFSVHLRYQNQCSDFYDSSSFYLLNMKHSTKYVQIQRSSLDCCRKTVELSFPFVFSGCYQLYINSGIKNEFIDGCMSRPFFIYTRYKKTPLDTIVVKHNAAYIVQRQELGFTSVFGNFSDELKPFLTAVTLKSDVDLSLEDCAGSGNKAGKYFLVQRGDCCHGLERPIDDDPHTMEYCPCRWENDVALDCTFRQVKNGNYCIIIQFTDPRCDTDSLWTKDGCAWSFNIDARGQMSSTETAPYQVKNSHSMVILYCLLALGILCTMGVMFTIFYFRRGKRKKRNIAIENIVEKSCFISEDDEILLLYPRDCNKFMTAMTLFRLLLKESCGCKVHDAWDEEIYDKVAESIETWSLPLIQNNNTKIIVVLTECSKIIEESYIGDNQFASYRDPKAFDKVFAQSIKALNEYFATRFDSYRRVFVVRLDETPVIDFSFHFNRATVYILPHGLQTLVDDLQNGNSTPINKESLVQFTLAIQEYQAYKQQYTNYLHDILNINNNSKKIKCVKNGIIR